MNKHRNQIRDVSSKYYYDPGRLDIDIAESEKKTENQKQVIRDFTDDLLMEHPANMDNTFKNIVGVMLELKEKYNIK